MTQSVGSMKNPLLLCSYKFKYLLFLLLTAGCVFANDVLAQEASSRVEGQARGIITARHQPVISSEITGRITKIIFREGESFNKNDLLLNFDKQLLNQQLEKTKAKLLAAKLKLDNVRHLEKLRSIGRLDVKLAETEVQSSKAEVHIAEIALGRCSIYAPFNGRVATLFADEHESIAANQKLIEIVGTDHLEVELMGPASWLSWLRQGLGFSVTIDDLNKVVQAEIVAVGAVVDPVSNTLKFHGKIESSKLNLLPGMMVTATFGVNN